VTRIRYFGVAAYEIITSDNKHVLIDPFLDDNPGSPIKSDQLGQVDLICVSHAAVDHLGDTEAIARRTNAPVICGGEVKAYLIAKGIPAEQIRATTWGIAVEVAGVKVQPLECHHWSQIKLPDGSFASGVPMAFMVHAAPDVRFYHYGDTAIFSDLKLQAELYKPTIGAIGITNPMEILQRFPMPGHMLTGEMSAYEGALAAAWLGLETVLPCHYCALEHSQNIQDLHDFHQALNEIKQAGQAVPKSVVMQPGDWLEV
jgi:L-ascorbate metabolism protein UlaG (beta-lactamase superfamily)